MFSTAFVIEIALAAPCLAVAAFDHLGLTKPSVLRGLAAAYLCAAANEDTVTVALGDLIKHDLEGSARLLKLNTAVSLSEAVDPLRLTPQPALEQAVGGIIETALEQARLWDLIEFKWRAADHLGRTVGYLAPGYAVAFYKFVRAHWPNTNSPVKAAEGLARGLAARSVDAFGDRKTFSQITPFQQHNTLVIATQSAASRDPKAAVKLLDLVDLQYNGTRRALAREIAVELGARGDAETAARLYQSLSDLHHGALYLELMQSLSALPEPADVEFPALSVFLKSRVAGPERTHASHLRLLAKEVGTLPRRVSIRLDGISMSRRDYDHMILSALATTDPFEALVLAYDKVDMKELEKLTARVLKTGRGQPTQEDVAQVLARLNARVDDIDHPGTLARVLAACGVHLPDDCLDAYVATVIEDDDDWVKDLVWGYISVCTDPQGVLGDLSQPDTDRLDQRTFAPVAIAYIAETDVDLAIATLGRFTDAEVIGDLFDAIATHCPLVRWADVFGAVEAWKAGASESNPRRITLAEDALRSLLKRVAVVAPCAAADKALGLKFVAQTAFEEVLRAAPFSADLSTQDIRHLSTLTVQLESADHRDECVGYLLFATMRQPAEDAVASLCALISALSGTENLALVNCIDTLLAAWRTAVPGFDADVATLRTRIAEIFPH